jgi:hypothetical protein
MEILKKAASIIIGSSAIATSIFVGLQSPVMAELVNVKLGDLGQSDLDAYCASKINLSNGQIVATLADTHVRCQVAISASGSSQSEAESNASLSGRNAGFGGQITASGQSGSQWQATFTSYQKPFHLNDWCRQKYSPNFYLPNPFKNGEGRIFVGDGGHACYKTENR